MLLQVKKVLVTISKLYDLLKSLKLLWSVTKKSNVPSAWHIHISQGESFGILSGGLC